MGWEERPILWSAEAKFRNGADRLDTLKNELLPWTTTREAIALTFAKNPDATEHSLIFSWIEEPPIERWGLLIGDCVHNLRSSLDHAVYGLAAAKSGADQPPHADSLAFPICNTDLLFREALGRHRLGSLASDVSVRAAIEDLQPYRRPNPPYVPLLAILRDLDNRDKHKLVSIIAAGLHTGEVVMNVPPMDPLPRTRVHFWTRGPMQESTEVFKVVFDGPAPDVQMSNPNLRIYPAIEVGMLDGETEAIGLTAGLGLLKDEVRYCLDAISRFL